ncbi:MAG: hypothetical protein ACLP62_08210 [Acidimicrobiales bacterium]
MTQTEAADRWALVDRRDFLRRSLDDADAEHEAGDLTDADHDALRRRDEALLAGVEARLAALELPADDAEPTPDGAARQARRPAAARARGWRPRRRAWMAVAGVAALAAATVVLVVEVTSPRLPGQVATGGAQLSGQRLVDQELDQAAVLADEGKVVTALGVYQTVLTQHPAQPTALAESGWLEWESGSGAGNPGLEQRGRAQVAKAVSAAPSFYAGHLYLGTIDYQEGDDAAAVGQYRLFLADHPPTGWTQQFASQIRGAFSAAGQAVPSGVPAS